MRRSPASKRQMLLPGAFDLQDGKRVRTRANPISHVRLLEELSSKGVRSIVEIYRHEVLPARTRSIRLLGRKCDARVVNTLLGFEVKASVRRILCPDQVTARYLKIFAELGCPRIRVPYDPTLTSRIVPEIEASQTTLRVGVERLFQHSRARRTYVLQRMYRLLRDKLRHD